MRRFMNIAQAVGIGGAIAIGMGFGTAAGWAVQFPDGTVAFEAVPQLVNFAATQTLVGRRATYYFTLHLPEGAGEPLETLTIELTEGREPLFRYRLEATHVFLGTRRDRGAAVPIAAVDYDAETQRLTVELAEPIAPGQDFTVALVPVRNPRWEGIYLFEVAAEPAGEVTRSQRIGTARLHIYRSGDRDPFWP